MNSTPCTRYQLFVIFVPIVPTWLSHLRQQRLFLAVLSFLAWTFPSVAQPTDWPQWRGPLRNGIIPFQSQTPPLNSLPASPNLLWKIPVGPGFSSTIVSSNQLAYLDLQDEFETVHLIHADTGKEIWKHSFAEGFGDEWGKGPRSTPLFDHDRLYVQSCKGEFQCLSRSTGSTLWRTHFETNFGVTFVGTKVNEGAAIRRGHNGSAVIHGPNIIVPVGSTNGACLVAFDKRTGAIQWKALNDETAYTSPIIASLCGVTQIVALTADALTGVNPDNGKVLWYVPVKTNAKRHAVSPVVIDDHHIFIASHSLGAQCIEIQKQGETWSTRIAWSNTTLKINLSSPVLYQGNLYGLGGGPDYVCINADTGQIRWSQTGFGRGAKTDYASSIVTQDRLLILDESGQLFLLRPKPDQFEELGRLQVSGKTWSHPAYAHDLLFVRDQRELKCLKLQP